MNEANDRDLERTKVGSFFFVYFEGNVINVFLLFLANEEAEHSEK